MSFGSFFLVVLVATALGGALQLAPLPRVGPRQHSESGPLMPGVAANERLTALTGGLLFVLIVRLMSP